MTAPEASQLDYWNGPGAERWIASREQLDRALEPITGAALALAAPRPGERVLDVGCGCGTTSLRLRELVAPGGTVLGVDISAPMIAVARERAGSGGRLELVAADAATHRFRDSFDLTFSRFGVMFFADPVAAFAGLRAALAPGGRLVFVCWRAMEENPWATAPLAAAAELLPPAEAIDPRAPSPFAFADGSRVRSILERAGFSEVQITAHDDVMILGDTVERAVEHTLTVGPMARLAAELSDQARQEIRSRVARALERYTTPRGIAPGAAAWLVRCSG